jgi:hypothetical protein
MLRDDAKVTAFAISSINSGLCAACHACGEPPG